jgi:hypothetical protein
VQPTWPFTPRLRFSVVAVPRGLSIEPAVGSVEVVEVLPLLELVVEQLGVVDYDAGELAVELLVVDPMRALDFAVQPRRGRPDVGVADAAVEPCQWNPPWNSAPLSVWTVSTRKGSFSRT